MAAKALGKARNIELTGVDGVSVPSPVYNYDRIQYNDDGTLTVLIKFWQDQASYDAGEPHFHVQSYQINEPVSLDNLLNTELKTLPDFDMAP